MPGKSFSHNLIFVLILFSFLSCSKAGKDQPIRLGYLQNDLHHLPLFISLEKGLFKKAGLDVKISGIFKAGPEEMSAFAAGELDIGYVGQAPATAAFLNNIADIKFISQSNQEGSSIMVRKGSMIRAVSDLRSKSVAIPGHATMQDFLLRKALSDAGVGIDDIKLIVLKPPEMLQALLSKNIDAFIAWEPYPSQAIIGNNCRELVSSSIIWKDHPCCVVIADTEFFKKNPAIISKFKEIHKQACLYIRNNKDESVMIGQKFTGMDSATVKKAISKIKYGPALDRKKAVQFVDFLNKLRYIKPHTPPRSIQSVFIK